ncbi:MAG: serpin family protein [Oscillospiraceae bacterium]|nr:serpin family protein [Oscillospiraceae bacterium]
MKFKKLISVLSSCVLLSGCGAVQESPDIQTNNLTSSVQSQPVSVSETGTDFQSSQLQFAVNLFQQTVSEHADENVLVSPLSVMLALSMTANGANGETLSEMEQVLGNQISDLNQNLYSYTNSLPSGEKAKFSLANSIWCRNEEGFTVNPDFIQTDANYYQADVYQEDFSPETCDKINQWVSQKTNGMIDSIIDTIDSNTMMYLINALSFDAEWLHIYEDTDIREGQTFTSADGIQQTVTMMHSSENIYLESEQATGFIKPYADGYSFIALLPDEKISVDDYITSLTPDFLSDMLANAQDAEVIANMPKFKNEFETSLVDTLTAMGMPTAFSSMADFSGMSDINLHIGDVLHKTFIEVDERGTKAGAVTAVQMDEEGIMETEPKFVTLDRPFVYMIVDNQNNLPLFIGTVKEIQE